MINDEQLKTLRVQLEEELASVEHQLQEYGATPDRDRGMTVDTDEGFADSAAATTERSEILSMIDQLQNSHAGITGALRRMDEGTYGKCERCGRDIPFERLEARPVARLCVSCQQTVGASR
ncbi:MAG: TraR/DksA family transcriptional regulator [Actinomycetota bacterium]